LTGADVPGYELPPAVARFLTSLFLNGELLTHPV